MNHLHIIISDCCLTPCEKCFSENKVTADNMITMFALNYSNALSWVCIKQQKFPDKQVAQLRHIILIQSQSVFDLTPYKYVLFGKAENTNFIIFGLTRLFLDFKIYSIRCTHNNHYNTNAAVNALVSTLTLEH